MQRHTVAQLSPASLIGVMNARFTMDSHTYWNLSKCDSQAEIAQLMGGFPTRPQMFLLSRRREVAALPGATVTYFLHQITMSCIFLTFQMVLRFQRTARKQILWCNFRADKLCQVLFRFFFLSYIPQINLKYIPLTLRGCRFTCDETFGL